MDHYKSVGGGSDKEFKIKGGRRVLVGDLILSNVNELEELAAVAGGNAVALLDLPELDDLGAGVACGAREEEEEEGEEEEEEEGEEEGEEEKEEGEEGGEEEDRRQKKKR